MAVMHLAQLAKDTQDNILAIGTALNAVPGQIYKTTDTERLGYGKEDGSIALIPQVSELTFQTIADSNSIDLALSNGELSAEVKLSADADNVLSLAADGLKVQDISIEAGSASFLGYNTATRELSVKQLLISDVTVVQPSGSGGQDTLAAWAAANYTGTEVQKGDVVIIEAENAAYIHHGGGAGDETDFKPIEVPGLSNSAIRALFSSGNAAINYNPATGVYTFTLDPASDGAASITANGLLIDTSAGAVTDTHDILGGGVVDTTVQGLFDGVANIANSAIQSFNLAGTTGTPFSVTDGASVSIQGGNLLVTDMNAGALTIDFDTAAAAVGNVPTYDGTNIVWGSAESPLTFENGMVRTADTVKLGGALTEDTTLTGNAFNFQIDTIGSIGSTDTTTSSLVVDHDSGVTMKSIVDASGVISSTEIVTSTVGYAKMQHIDDANAVTASVTVAPNTTTIFGTSIVLSGDTRMSSYANTRDDSGSEAVSNLLYTDLQGNVLSAPISSISNDYENGITLANDVVKLGGALTGATAITGTDDFSLSTTGTILLGTDATDKNYIKVSQGAGQTSNRTATANSTGGGSSWNDGASLGYAGKYAVHFLDSGIGSQLVAAFETVPSFGTLATTTGTMTIASDVNAGAGVVAGTYDVLHVVDDGGVWKFVIDLAVTSTFDNAANIQYDTEGLIGQPNYFDFSGDLKLVDYASTRDDSSTVTPINLLYTDAQGKLLSTPFSTVQNNYLNGINKSGSEVKLGGDLTEGTILTMNGQTLALNGTGAAVNVSDVSAAMSSTVTGTKTANQTFALGTATTRAQNADNSQSFQLGFDFENGATFTDARSTTTGMEYAADYSADFTDRTLVDKAYVDGVAGQFAGTFNSGLTRTGDTVQLGGSLVQATALDMDNFDFTFNSTGTGIVKSSIDMEFTDAAKGVIMKAADGTRWRLGAQSFGNGSAVVTLEAVA